MLLTLTFILVAFAAWAYATSKASSSQTGFSI